MNRRVQALVMMAWLFCCAVAHAAGPRWIAGSQWTNNGQIMPWFRANLQYFVDPGPLSSSVNHASAVALVDAAVAVWNVAGVNFTVTNGGALAEDVSGDNVYVGTSGLLWPADVQSTNYTAIPIAVVFDADGSIIDTLLGTGASEPTNCRQNAVAETTDLFIQPGKIAHAIIVVNGRCTGPAAEQQMQLQYQMERVFGRVIGLGWSQTNDNVFTGSPAPTYWQQQHWPIMHPVDILCGPYSYQCLPQPFTLRDDDVAALRLVYAADIRISPAGLNAVNGTLAFASGLGMNGVNVTLQRNYPWYGVGTEPFQDVSGVTGYATAGDMGNAVNGGSADTLGTGGSKSVAAGVFLLYGITPLTYSTSTNFYISAEALNPLYVGNYAVGPYRMGTPRPSGVMAQVYRGGNPVGYFAVIGKVTLIGSSFDCVTSADGTETSPAELPADGVWEGLLCGVGHAAWSTLAVRAGRTATLEVTSTDETGGASTAKALPVTGMWHAADATGTTPTMAAVKTAFNSIRTGTTQMRVAFAATEHVRFVIADQRGDGRPDYTYHARLLYADTVTPARLSAAGGAIHIVGTGFQPGNTVTVGGVLAQVVGLSATAIDAIAPTAAALHGSAVNDVAVTDARTGGATTISGGLTYGGASTDVLSLVTVPPSAVSVGVATLFAVRLLDVSGKPAVNASVVFTANGGGAVFSACTLATCTLVTDATGLAQTQVVASSAGVVALQAKALSASTVQASYNAVLVARAVTPLRPTEYVASGAGARFAPAMMVTANGVAAAAQAVAWVTPSPRIALGAALDVTAGDGSVAVNVVGSLMDGEMTSVQACAWSTVCGTQTLIGVAPANLRVVIVSGDAQSMTSAGTLGQVVVRVVDTAGHAVAGAAVGIYQQVTGWQPPCSGSGRCATPPVYGKSTVQGMSDDDGLVRIAPLQYDGTAAVTKITVSAGTLGVATATLEKTF